MISSSEYICNLILNHSVILGKAIRKKNKELETKFLKKVNVNLIFLKRAYTFYDKLEFSIP